VRFGGLGLPALPALARPRLPLAAFRRRIVFHGVFLLLALATVALALTLLAEEKQRSRQRYEAGFRQTLAEAVARLRNPAGQLALLNAGPQDEVPGGPTHRLVPLVLPFSALDFDDPFKARQAVEMSGCALRWPGGDQLCAAVGSSAYAGGFIYLVASLDLPPAQARERGATDLETADRARVSLELRGTRQAWTAPFEAAADAPVRRAGGGLRGRLTGFAGTSDQVAARARPDPYFRGWLWQDASCVVTAAQLAPSDAGLANAGCLHHSLLSIRLPVQAYQDALFETAHPAWPPADLDRVVVRLEWLSPAGVRLFDSDTPGAAAPFALHDLASVLAAGETLRIQREPGRNPLARPHTVAVLRGQPDAQLSSPWLTRLILRLPAGQLADILQADDEVITSVGRYRVTLSGDMASVDRSLGATATRMIWFVGAMLAAIGLAWLIIDVGLMRRMAVLTQRAAALSYNIQDPQVERRLGELEVADLRGRDELGILAGTLAALLQRVKDAAWREHVRAEQERDVWHAVGHEIMSPLQSLLALHSQAGDPSHRYLQRMQQAVRVLYGSASPSEAIASAALRIDTLDLDDFLRHVAANAHFAGLNEVRYLALGTPLLVRADAHSLEDAVTHVLRNADRHRLPGTPITLTLERVDSMAELSIHNQGAPIPPALLERIFEYGVSDSRAQPEAAPERRGQGLFVARTYMAKMDGSITARNVEGGVSFIIRLPSSAA
jgi:signal transduction histidine kinase